MTNFVKHEYFFVTNKYYTFGLVIKEFVLVEYNTS